MGRSICEQAAALQAAHAGEVALLVGCLPNERLIAIGGVDFRPSEDAGSIWMLAVHERFQSSESEPQLIAALEHKIIDHGRPLARMLVEHDNPRARSAMSVWAIPRLERRSTAGR